MRRVGKKRTGVKTERMIDSHGRAATGWDEERRRDSEHIPIF